MTPKEKAAELIVNYQLKCKSLNYDEAKQCALIAVDEIIYSLEDSKEHIDDNYLFIFNNKTIKFWQEVKQEIESI